MERKRYTRAELTVRTTGLALLACLFLFVACLSVFAAWNMYKRAEMAKEDSIKSQKDLAQITEQDNSAKAEVNRLSTASGIEAALRERFGVVRPGEGVIVLKGVSTTMATTSIIPKQNTFFENVWKSVF